MRRVLSEMGYNGENHVAQPYTQDLLNWSDEIICMSHLHVTRITKKFQVDPLKIKNWEIVDPFRYIGEDTHRLVANQIKEKVFLHFLGKQS